MQQKCLGRSVAQLPGLRVSSSWTLFSRLPCRSAFCFSSLRFVFLASGALHSRYSRTAEAPRRRWRFSAELQDSDCDWIYLKVLYSIVRGVRPTRTEHNFALNHVATAAANVELRIPGSHSGVCHWLFRGHLPILSSFLVAQLSRCAAARNMN